MKKTNKTGLFCLLCLGFSGIFGLLLPDQSISAIERRPLSGKPILTVSALQNGTYMSSMDNYLSDQFPLRDSFRKFQVFLQKNLFLQKDINGYYSVGKGIYSLDSTLHEDKVARVAKGFSEIAEEYFPAANIYYSIIPDKNYYVADSNGYPTYDYPLLENTYIANFPNGTNLPLWDRLSIEDYYLTDPHWKQEKLVGISAYLCNGMNVSLSKTFINTLVRKCYYEDFIGSYGRQSGFSCRQEKIYALSNSLMESFRVTDWETKEKIPLYHPEKLENPDSYDFYLAGAKALITIENSSVQTDRELFLFRDSFGSPLAPLLAACYSKVTVIDLRYVSPTMLFSLNAVPPKADVLFLYSTMLLNHSDSLRFF